MAQVSNSIPKSLVVVLAMTILSAVVSAQELASSPSPSPAASTGSGFSLPVSGAVVGFSLALSLLGLLKH
ncbi:No apical meristem (NAM) protein [Melia azedarach]|uniref:No apical meristem (NAM) protein n=1 Tax=Melia azedarach TaxID=155640 RepID=A0ACC1X6Z4_MELAZ|nr:No apical meristem (NAM) protein [Melia azedarach]